MFVLRKLLGIDSNTPEVKEAIGFNPANVGLIEGDGVAYGLSYQDNGNGSSKVKLLISPLYQSKTYECSTNISVANEFKGQLSLTLIENSAEVDKIGVIFPTEEINKEEKCIKGLTFNTYEIKHSTNVPLVEYVGKVKLYKNIDINNLANEGNSYFQPKAVKVGNGNVIVIAHNLKDQTLVSWYLKLGKSGKFKVLDGKGFTERKLFKFGNPGQLVLNENTMLYSQVSKRITKENQEVRKTRIFKFDMAKVIQGLRDGVNGFLLGNGKGQIDNKALSLSREYEISFLQYVEGGDLVAFLAEGRSPNKQTLHLTSLVKNGSKSDFTVCEFEDSIKQLYVKNNGQDSFIVTAINEGNITICNHQRFEKPSKVTIIPANSIKTLSDFVNIINGRLTPDIIFSSTVAPVTIIETVVTSKKTPTAAIASTTETDTVKTTKLTTEAVTPTSTMSKPSTSTVTVKPTTVAKTTTTSQATTVATTSTSVPSETETSTVKPTAATVASTSTMSKPSTSTVTVEPTTEAVASTSTMNKPSTTQTSTVTVEPTTSSERTTQTVSTMPSTRTRELTTPMFTTTLFSQSTSSPQPTQLAIGSNRAGMIGGSLVGAIGIVGIIGFIAYRYVKGRNAAPVLELTDLGYRRRSSSSSDEEIFTTGDRMRTIYQSETVLNSISVESSSRSRSSSSSSSSGPGS